MLLFFVIYMRKQAICPNGSHHLSFSATLKTPFMLLCDRKCHCPVCAGAASIWDRHGGAIIIQALGLTKTYKSATEESTFLKTFFGMSYLHPAEVLEFWTKDLTPLEPEN